MFSFAFVHHIEMPYLAPPLASNFFITPHPSKWFTGRITVRMIVMNSVRITHIKVCPLTSGTKGSRSYRLPNYRFSDSILKVKVPGCALS